MLEIESPIFFPHKSLQCEYSHLIHYFLFLVFIYAIYLLKCI